MAQHWLMLLLAVGAVLAVLPAARGAVQEGRVRIAVAETLGQRRYGYPVRVAVPLPRGAVRTVDQLALTARGQVLAQVQYDGLARWPDGTLQWALLSCNRSPGPLETEELELRYGPGVSHPDPGAAVVEETPEAFTVRGAYRLPRGGPAFLESIRYGPREFLRAPARWSIAPASRRGPAAATFPLLAGSGAGRVVAPGPLCAAIELRGSCPISGGAGLSYHLIVLQPNSKSWFETQLELENPERRSWRATLELPFKVEAHPVLYDFGVGGWLYGRLRVGESATLRIRDNGWQLLAQPFTAPGGTTGPLLEAASSPAQPRAEGWGHLVDGEQGGRAVAFGSPELAGRPGELVVAADGTVTLSWVLPRVQRPRVRAFAHMVFDPVQVTAVTSPAAMLHPLRVSLPAAWYRRCAAGAAPLE